MIATAAPVTYGHDSSIARFSVARYQKMVETGILTPEDKVELLENYVVLKMTRNPLHDSTLQRMLRPLMQFLPIGWDVRIQGGITLADSQPEPNFALVRGSSDDYVNRHPGTNDVGLLIEVADSSLLRDQRDKTRIYARAGIPSYWIINLVDRRIESFTQPSGPAPVPVYGSFQVFQPGDAIPACPRRQHGRILASGGIAPSMSDKPLRLPELPGLLVRAARGPCVMLGKRPTAHQSTQAGDWS